MMKKLTQFKKKLFRLFDEQKEYWAKFENIFRDYFFYFLLLFFSAFDSSLMSCANRLNASSKSDSLATEKQALMYEDFADSLCKH